MENEKIAVIGSNGLIGSALTKALSEAEQSWAVYGLQRSPSQREESTGHRSIDLLDETTFDAALEGMNTLVICVSAPAGQEKRLEHDGVVSLAKRAEQLGATRIVYVSGIATPTAQRGFKAGWAKRQTEANLKMLSIPINIIRPSWLMESLPRMLRDGNVSIIGQGRDDIHWLALRDLTSVIVGLLLSPPINNTEWNVMGPEPVTLKVAAEKFAAHLDAVLAANQIALSGQ